MSTCIFDDYQGPNNSPANFPFGFRVGAGRPGSVNDIGVMGGVGAGVGICPGPLPYGMAELSGTHDLLHDNYGNYRFADGSIMPWVPSFFYKWGTGSNGLAINQPSIRPYGYYQSVALAAADGYAFIRAGYDGSEQPGFFYDKFFCSNNNGVASSLKNGIPLATGGGYYPINALNGAPALNYGGCQAAAKTRGSDFFAASIFQRAAVALLSYAHAWYSGNATYCAWYLTNCMYPKGANNNALGDVNDAAILYQSAGDPTYPTKPKTGSANLFARTTHNGQNSGIADINGGMWQVAPGLTSDGTSYFALKTTKRMRDMTGGNSLATDLWGAAGLAANFDNIGATIGAATGANNSSAFGSLTPVFSEATSGAAWQASGAGIPLATGTGGTNSFGNDGFWNYRPNEMCPISGGAWYGSSAAGAWALHLSDVRGTSTGAVGFRAALYL